MTIKLNTLERWSLLKSGEAIKLEASMTRRVRVHFNLPQAVNLHATFATGETQFVAALDRGRNLVEFVHRGAIALYPDDPNAEVWYQTAEGEPSHVVPVDQKSFARIMERRARNPELEAIVYAMQTNMERRAAAMAHDLEKRFNAALAAERKGNGDQTRVHVGEAPEHPEPDADGKKKGAAGKPSAKASKPPKPVEDRAKGDGADEGEES